MKGRNINENVNKKLVRFPLPMKLPMGRILFSIYLASKVSCINNVSFLVALTYFSLFDDVTGSNARRRAEVNGGDLPPFNSYMIYDNERRTQRQIFRVPLFPQSIQQFMAFIGKKDMA